jgi:putative restriction endonuclease
MANGYIGLTDPDWYAFLRDQPRVDEVNFWKPHGGQSFRALNRGELFFFKLRAPHKAIAGFGFFDRYENLSARLAWDAFGEMNGAATFPEMIDRITRLRRDEQGVSELTGNFQIGCILLSAPVFFEEHEWVEPPFDWAKSGIQQGKGYDLTHGEGQRVFVESMLRARQSSRYWNVERTTQIVPEGAERYGNPVLVRPRLGQGLFSFAVRDAYEGACAITHEHSVPVLEAAHIRPYSIGGEHKVDNGILLRSDVHKLFDLGYVTVTPDYIFKVGDRLRDEFRNGRSYYSLNGKGIALPSAETLRPKRDLLAWHLSEKFLG